MSSQTLPLATLAAQVSVTGISAPTIEDIIDSEIAIYQGIYGSDVVLNPGTQDFQLIAARCAAINDTNNLAIAVYNSFLPGYAQGVGLSAIVQINGIGRDEATNSTVVLEVGGTAGTIIPAGQPTDANGNVWLLPPNTVIPSSGVATVTATAQNSGNVSAAPGTVNSISPIIAGWQSVTNPAPAIVGQAVEGDAALRQRQAASTALSAQTQLAAILAAVANSGGIGRYTIYENDTKVPDVNGQPGNTVAVVVEGGNVQTIAQVIQQKKAPGIGTYGTTSVLVQDVSGVPSAIQFFELAEVPIYVSITIQPLAGYVSTTGSNSASSIASFISSLAIGQDVYLNWVIGQSGLPGTSLATTFSVVSIAIGTSPSSLSAANIPIAFNCAASCATANVAITTLPAA